MLPVIWAAIYPQNPLFYQSGSNWWVKGYRSYGQECPCSQQVKPLTPPPVYRRKKRLQGLDVRQAIFTEKGISSIFGMRFPQEKGNIFTVLRYESACEPDFSMKLGKKPGNYAHLLRSLWEKI